MKNIAYSPQYVDNIIQDKDVCALITLIEIRGRVRPIPEQCLLFREVIYWMGSCRSGMYQYYEGRRADDEDFTKFSDLLTKFELQDVLEQYSKGMSIWHDVPQDLSRYNEIEEWVDLNEDQITEDVLALLKASDTFLKNNEGA